ncbi:virulence-associated E family protein [Companilactobacillus sp. HBUAS59699]|uniref:virulence-associated E family protein n=1 Tax=Companilactobacillus sp. HBUAS59699 TaxID=3109358 RepID=UPI002FF3FF8D
MEKELQNKIKELSQSQNDTNKIIDLWKEKFLKTDKGTPRSNSSKNVYLILQNDARLKGLLQYNEFSEQIVKRVPNESLNTLPGDWQDSDDSKLKLFIEENYGYVATRDAIGDAIIKFSMDHSFNPIKERIESVAWDGTPRVETFFIDYLGTEDSEYVREITKRWLTGAVARVYRPGIKFEIVPILFGGQGIGKSTLAGSIYRDYFLDELDSMGKQKDDFQKLKGKWIVEIGELSAMRRTDVEHVKSFISAQSDNYRPSFGKYATDHPRKSVFIGTSNPPEFLKDKTGNRRFFPIECDIQEKKKDPFNIDDADVLQVLAEAKVMYDNGVKIFVDTELQKVSEKYQKDSMIQDPTEEQILSYIDMLVPINWNDYTVFKKERYFDRFNKNEGFIDKSGNTLSNDELVQINQVTTNDILQVAFNISSDQLLSASRGNVGKQISDVMNNLDNWKRNKHIYRTENRPNGTRGYIRK